MYKEIKDRLATISREQNTAQNDQADLKKNQVEFLRWKIKSLKLKTQ